MGGKKNKQEVSSKTEKKMKEKIVEDKTFGLKNKNKSTKVQNYCKSIQHQVMNGNNAKGGIRGAEEQKHQQAKEKKEKAKNAALLASLYGMSQDLNKKNAQEAQIKAEQKIDLYKDPRTGTENMPEDTIITCKHFLDAVEDDKYGWRWECPNGDKCAYRHQLPDGFILVSKKEREQMKKEAEEAAKNAKASLEEEIEAERAALPSDGYDGKGLTPVTKESFFAWKARRAAKKQADLEQELKDAEEAKAKGKNMRAALGGKQSVMNGRALFSYNPDLFKDEDDAPKQPTVQETKIAEEEEEKQSAPQEEAKVDENLFAEEVNPEDEDVDFD